MSCVPSIAALISSILWCWQKPLREQVICPLLNTNASQANPIPLTRPSAAMARPNDADTRQHVVSTVASHGTSAFRQITNENCLCSFLNRFPRLFEAV
jgi:hypothetical protein